MPRRVPAGARVSAQPDFASGRSTPRAARVPSERLFVLAGAGLLACALTMLFTTTRALDAARASEQDARLAARDADARLRTARTATNSTAELLAQRASLAGVAPPPRVLTALQAAMPGAVRLEQATLTYSAQVDLELRVVARGARDYDAFIERLGATPAFRALATGPENREGEVRALIRLQHVARSAP